MNLALTRNNVVDDHYVYAGAPLLRRLGVRPGDAVDRARARWTPTRPRTEEPLAALEAAGRVGRLRPSPSTRRRLLQPVQSARRASTRAERLSVLLERLRAGSAG